jgi:hypothetical protein
VLRTQQGNTGLVKNRGHARHRREGQRGNDSALRRPLLLAGGNRGMDRTVDMGHRVQCMGHVGR